MSFFINIKPQLSWF